MFKKSLLNIVSINERFAYSLIGKLRQLIVPFFNSFLSYQQRSIQKNLNDNITIIKKNLVSILPKINQTDLVNFLTQEEQQKIVSEADKILQHEFHILSTSIQFKENIDWNLDFSSGFRWPKGKLYYKYNQVDHNNNADVKFPRELSRCHHFLNLGEAYILTKDEKYTKEYITQVRSWIQENPYKKSINWGCSMDIAIRASNWIYSLRMFVESPMINDVFTNEIMTSLYLHGRYIYENPEKNRIYNHNHYLSDLAGQILISLLFNSINTKETELWKDNGIYELFREIRVQILPTGFTYERTTNYQRLVTELISYTIIMLKNNNIEVPQDIMFRIENMFECTLYYLVSDGTAPIIGDQDNGRFLPFYPNNINYQKYLLNIGAVLFNDSVFKSYSGVSNIDVLFLFGNNGLQRFNELKPEQKTLKSKSFPDAGFYIMRSDKIYLFINNSGLSHYNEVVGGTHTHSDLLSFFYAYNNVPFLIDPGTYVYSSNPKERMKFRSTSMHNTLTIDDFDQNELKETELWSIKRDAIPNEMAWFSDTKVDIYEGSHSGYERLNDPVRHSRKFELNKETNNLVIKDKIDCKKEHLIKCHFHFDEKVNVEIEDNVIYCESGAKRIKLSFKINTDFLVEIKEEYVSKAYNSRLLAPYAIVSFKSDRAIELTTVVETIEND